MKFPIRSAIELASFLAFILLSYDVVNDILLSSSIGCVCGIVTCLISEGIRKIFIQKSRTNSQSIAMGMEAKTLIERLDEDAELAKVTEILNKKKKIKISKYI